MVIPSLNSKKTLIGKIFSDKKKKICSLYLRFNYQNSYTNVEGNPCKSYKLNTSISFDMISYIVNILFSKI